MDAKELIQAFYDISKDKYPGLSLEDIDEICRAPFEFVKKSMENSTTEISSIRLKFLGVFTVNLRSAITLHNGLDLATELGKVDQERATVLKETLRQFITTHPNYTKVKDEQDIEEADSQVIEVENYEEAGDLGECESLPSGEPEVQDILQQLPTDSEADSPSYQRADRLPAQDNGQGMF